MTRQVVRHRATFLGPPFAVLALVAFAVLAAGDPDASASTTAQIMGVALVVVAPLAAAIRCRVVLDDDGVTVHRMVRTATVPWDEIAAVSANYYGLHVHRYDGTTVTAGSLGRPSWARWSGIESKADRLVATIADEAERRRR